MSGSWAVEEHHAAIEAYYRAFRDRDRAKLESLLLRDFHFVSGFGEYRDRDAMLDEIWPDVGQAWATDLRIFGEGPDYVVVYEHGTPLGSRRPRMRMAELVHFEGERIARIEVFVGRTSRGESPT
jgi:hypothetical protein